ncbi:hypothetical protein XA68_10632 [Ophiocordyceps unilateralis]|uniref:Uncharacterized protein n=1 Tax=Ophiocordyceps unilateralis TaxID=268505 RepID=A0A2A9PHX0_OPHUN|nr:hypothetical protein XA68_10632 [Ophiocordyceps unilateralis]
MTLQTVSRVPTSITYLPDHRERRPSSRPLASRTTSDLVTLHTTSHLPIATSTARNSSRFIVLLRDRCFPLVLWNHALTLATESPRHLASDMNRNRQ